MSIPFNTVVGGRDLCAWQPAPGITWVQTREPRHARRLAQRADGRVVAYSVAGGYLKTFEFPHTLSWAIRLIARYTGNQTPTNEPISEAAASPANPKGVPAMGVADREIPALCGAFSAPDRTILERPALRPREPALAGGGGDSPSWLRGRARTAFSQARQGASAGVVSGM